MTDNELTENKKLQQELKETLEELNSKEDRTILQEAFGALAETMLAQLEKFEKESEKGKNEMEK